MDPVEIKAKAYGRGYKEGKEYGKRVHIRDENLSATIQLMYQALGSINRVTDTGLVGLNENLIISAQHHIHQAKRALEKYGGNIVKHRQAYQGHGRKTDESDERADLEYPGEDPK